MYSAVASRALDGLEGQLPPGVLQTFVNLFANCQLPLSHSAPINVTASASAPRVYVDDLFQDALENHVTNNDTFSTMSVNNPFSVIVNDSNGDPSYVDNGWSMWSYGTAWWAYAVVNNLVVNKQTVKKLKINKLEHDGYQFEDRRVLDDVTVTFSFDSNTCQGTVTTTKHYVNIKTLVRNDNAGGNSPAKDPDEDSAPDQPSQNQPSQNTPSQPSQTNPPTPGTGPTRTTDTTTFSFSIPGLGNRANDPILDVVIQDKLLEEEQSEGG